MRMECPACKSALREKGAGDIWLDEDEFSRIRQEMKGEKTARPAGPAAIAQAAAQVRSWRTSCS